MFSPTQERLRTMVERLSSALTDQVRVVVVPGDAWAAFPAADPPKIVYKLGDVGVMGEDETLGVTAHEIAHLLYTTAVDWKFDVSKRPRAAHLLLNAVEDARIERVFSDAFPGAQSLFDTLRSDQYDAKVQRGFDDLPIKWRFVLNIDRVLHGIEPWGEQIDVDAIELVLDDVIEAMMSDTTQEAADCLEKAYHVMLDLMRKEAMDADPDMAKNFQGVPISVPPEWLGLPPDYTPIRDLMEDEEDAQQRSGDSTDHAFPEGAEQDDHMVGGTDGTDGSREKADGSQGGSIGEGTTGEGEGDSSQGVEGGSGTGGEGAPGTSTTADASGGAGGSGYNDPLDSESESSPGEKPGIKPTNIIDEMVQEESGSRNKAIDILSYRQRQRAKEARKIEEKIRGEESDYLRQLERIFGRHRSTHDFRERMKRNEQQYRTDQKAFAPQISALRNFAQNVLRDNALERFGGNRTSGRKIKTSRLYRVHTRDPRLFERKEYLGGKSYDIGLVIDQSASMRGPQQQLAYQAALIFLEAFDGLAGTSVVGFSDMGWDDRGHLGNGDYYRTGWSVGATPILSRTYKDVDSDLRMRWAAIPELMHSFQSTPMEAGVEAMTVQLRRSMKEVKALIVISDGEPNDPRAARAALMVAKKLGILTYGLHIGAQRPFGVGYTSAGFNFLTEACDRAEEVYRAAEVPAAVNRMLRGIIRTRRAAS